MIIFLLWTQASVSDKRDLSPTSRSAESGQKGKKPRPQDSSVKDELSVFNGLMRTRNDTFERFTNCFERFVNKMDEGPK